MKKPENLVSLIVYAALLVISVVLGLVSGSWSAPAAGGTGIQFNLGNIAAILAQASPIFHSSCEGKLGIALE